jgi:hypothetical protein
MTATRACRKILEQGADRIAHAAEALLPKRSHLFPSNPRKMKENWVFQCNQREFFKLPTDPL